MGRLEEAVALDKKASHLLQELGSHDGIARVCVSLAGLAFARKKLRESSRYLITAGTTQQSRTASMMITMPPFRRPRQAELAGDFKTAIVHYQRSLDLWKQKHIERAHDCGLGLHSLGEGIFRGGRDATCFRKYKAGVRHSGSLPRTSQSEFSLRGDSLLPGVGEGGYAQSRDPAASKSRTHVG
jgi:hypothetical protein